MNEQLNIFSVFRRNFEINNKIRLIELFAGVGSQAMALKWWQHTTNKSCNTIPNQETDTKRMLEIDGLFG